MKRFPVLVVLLACLLLGCKAAPPAPVEGLTVFVGATVIDGTGRPPVENGVVVVRDGRIEAVGAVGEVAVPDGAAHIDLTGKTIMPGLINAHGHVGSTRGLEAGPYSAENVLDHLALYARYGVTTVNSLGGDEVEGVQVRDAQDTAALDRARLFVAGAVVTGETPEEAAAMVESNAALNVDFIKIRVDDNLGSTQKMTPEVYQAVLEEAHARGLQVASHLYYLDDAKALLEAGTDFVAHSIRDRDVDDEVIALLKEKEVCYCPTLTREVSTFVYEAVPAFFEDSFFLKEADPEILEQLKDPERQQGIKDSPAAQQYKQALEQALRNLGVLAGQGVTIAMGTDSGPPARFQGYFEHMEMALMAEAGMTPMQILVSATGDAARCLGFDDLGTLEIGHWADLVVLTENPLEDIRNTRTIESVWIAGNRVPEKEAG